MATPRAVRIPRSGARAGGARPNDETRTSVDDPGSIVTDPGAVRRSNVAGLQRSTRLAAVYVVPLLAMYLFFVALDRAAPGGSAPITSNGILAFTGLFALLAVVGVVLVLGPTPRAVEIGADSLVVIEWTGRRRIFPPLADLRVELIRRYPAGPLSSAPVVAVEITGGARRRTYHLSEGLLPEGRPRRDTGTG